MAKTSASPHAADRQADHRSRAESQSPPVDMPALVAAHHAAVYRYARRLTGCAAQAEDLTQQTFLIAQQKLDQLRDPARSGGWLLAIARNCFLKSRRRPEPAAASVGINVEHLPGRTTAGDAIDREALEQALAQLPDEFRLVLLMFYFEELSYQEIAAQLELPLGTVMSRMSRAKTQLRSQLAPPAEAARPAARRPPNGALKPVPVRVVR